jgi:hypothetical protein
LRSRTDDCGLRWDNIGRLLDLKDVPNDKVRLTWELRKETQGGITALVFERPYLVWSQTMTFEEGDWFRFA